MQVQSHTAIYKVIHMRPRAQPYAFYFSSLDISFSSPFLKPISSLEALHTGNGATLLQRFTYSFIHSISIAPLQVRYYSDALPTQHEYCAGVSRRSATGLAQGPYVAVRAGFELTTLQSKSFDSTNAPPRPTLLHMRLFL